jgi:hypothetical protein
LATVVHSDASRLAERGNLAINPTPGRVVTQ